MPVSQERMEALSTAPELSTSRRVAIAASLRPWGDDLRRDVFMRSFKEFWPLYLYAHQHRGTRIGHYVATTIALSTVAASIALQAIWLTILGIVLGYGIALASHRLCDGSKSLVLVNPVWGALADFRMCWLALTGGLAAELAEHVGPPRARADGSMIRSPR